MTFNSTVTSHQVPSENVPAGTFSDCWKRQWNDVAFTQEDLWCRGVGMVRFTEIDLAGGGFVVELSGKSF